MTTEYAYYFHEYPTHCLYPDCHHTPRTRGLCHGHYQQMRSYVRQGRATEADLERRGMLLAKGTPGPKIHEYTALLYGDERTGGGAGTCDPKCLGWFEGDTGIERCDACNAFPDDDEARAYVAELFRMLFAAFQDFQPGSFEGVLEEAIDPERHDDRLQHPKSWESGPAVLVRRMDRETE